MPRMAPCRLSAGAAQRERRHDDALAVRRAPDEEPSQRGTGLGLAIVKAIALAHGGDVVVATPPSGTGAGIGVRLPVGAA